MELAIWSDLDNPPRISQHSVLILCLGVPPHTILSTSFIPLQAKMELQEVVDFFRKPEKFRASGAKAPKGVLLMGPPGNGKTLMARCERVWCGSEGV